MLHPLIFRGSCLLTAAKRALFFCALLGVASCSSERLNAITVGVVEPGAEGGSSGDDAAPDPETGVGREAGADAFVSGTIHPPLHTEGNRIVDSRGNTVRLKGVNWYGLESASYEPLGIWARPLDAFMADIAQKGFNTVRLPFSNALLDPGTQPTDDKSVTSGLDMLKQTVESARNAGLMVVLVRHAGQAGKDGPPTGTCWNEMGTYGEARWLSDWQRLASIFLEDDNVVGFDLAKEPHDPAVWSGEGSDKDWFTAAQTAGNMILSVNPKVLIIVQGIQTSSDGSTYWNGGNLRDVDVNKRLLTLSVPNHVVYSTADYSSCLLAQPWLVDNSSPTGRPPGYPNNLPPVWDEFWGNLANTQPVLLSEFGTLLDPAHPEYEQWLQAITQYVGQIGVGFFYSRLNGSGTSGTVGGLLDNTTWMVWDERRMEYLRPLLASTP